MGDTPPAAAGGLSFDSGHRIANPDRKCDPRAENPRIPAAIVDPEMHPDRQFCHTALCDAACSGAAVVAVRDEGDER